MRRRPVGYTLERVPRYGHEAEQLRLLRDRLAADLRSRNAEKIAAVAASLPRPRASQVDGAHNSTKPQEFAAPRASTNLNSCGSLGGCFAHGTT